MASRSSTATKTRPTEDDSPLGPGGPPLLARLPIAAAAGVAMALAFPPNDWAYLAPFAAATLTLLCMGTGIGRGALIGFAFGLGYFVMLLKWLVVIGIDAWLATGVIEALFMALLGALISVVTRLRYWPFYVAALWVGIEYARAHIPLGGFPWGRVAYAFDDSPFGHWAAIGGVPFVTFLVVLAGNLLLFAIVASDSQALLRVIAFVAAVGLPFAGLLIPLPTAGNGTATVAIVQGNIPGRGLEPLGRARTVTRNHLAATEELMRGVADGKYPRPDFVLWPENSTDIDPFDDPITRETVESAVRVAGVPVLVGAILNGPGPTHRQTAGVVWDPKTGPGEVYAKRHPVPFGEYIPFRAQLTPYIKRLELVGRDTYPGDKPGLMEIAGTKLGLVICFEIAYDEIVRDVAAEDNTQLLTVQSNNATYMGSGQPEQQFAITRMRAIEYGKATLVASPSGISGVIAPDGRVIHQSQEATRQIYVEQVPLRTQRTLASVAGPGIEWGLAIVGCFAVIAAVFLRRRREG
ncbi:apolipoprotein N-acyltransferase [Tenggerimyces flavus]|uniref:Apolipoprotein N-acyltransferase n=1 Tax=Tenggerimyces flavus TaxID=1708749 RepID=A0ABV7YEB7_9ACTN|nr:apolipoprotein N-acyltransferase [Tenggerimyces flavus]MBM7788187.1 apolipoprotein N-acyltransferase [Tenggerimyces flavus]